MKYLFLSALIFFISFVIPLFAHETKTENPLSILLHIEPDDDPIAGEPAEIFFAFTDETQVFDIETCTCITTVKDQEKIIFEGPVTRTDESLYGKNVASATTIFPHTGQYNITISASPREGVSFTQTTLSYNVEIKREAKQKEKIAETKEENQNTLHKIHLYGICAGCIVLLGAGFVAFRQYTKRMV